MPLSPPLTGSRRPSLHSEVPGSILSPCSCVRRGISHASSECLHLMLSSQTWEMPLILPPLPIQSLSRACPLSLQICPLCSCVQRLPQVSPGSCSRLLPSPEARFRFPQLLLNLAVKPCTSSGPGSAARLSLLPFHSQPLHLPRLCVSACLLGTKGGPWSASGSGCQELNGYKSSLSNQPLIEPGGRGPLGDTVGASREKQEDISGKLRSRRLNSFQ